MKKDIPLLIFAKAPIPGKVKTRLTSHCTEEQAAEIAKLLLNQCLSKVCEFWPGEVLVSTWLDSGHPELISVCNEYDVKLVKQGAGDLGAKMHATFDERGYPCAILGSDAPHISRQSLTEAYDALKERRPVLGPSRDGGYYLIGLTESSPWLFNDMPWGTDVVLGETRQRISQQGQGFFELADLNDIDEWPDLIDVLTELPSVRDYLIDQGL